MSDTRAPGYSRWLPLGLICLVTLGSCDAGHHHHHDDHYGDRALLSPTRWGQHAELHVEYPPLVVDTATALAVHITRLDDFSPLSTGSVRLQLQQEDGSLITAEAPTPVSAGRFAMNVTPRAPGSCQLALTVTSEAWSEDFPLQPCQVHVTAPSAAAEQDTGIRFSKERQWTADFATSVVAKRPMRRTVRVNAEIAPVTGREAHLTAALPGRIQFAAPPPVIGMTLAKGQLLATVHPPLTGATNRATLRAELAATQAELDDAQAEAERVQKLAQAEAIAAHRVRHASTRVAVAESRLQAARERLRQYDVTASGRTSSGNAFRVRSPIAGTLVEVEVTAGETVAGGIHLFTVIDLERVWIEGRVFEPDIPLVLDAREASFSVEGYPQPFAIDESNGRLVTVGQVLDPANRTVPIVFEVANPERRLRIGQFAVLEVAVGPPVVKLAVPDTAVVDDGGSVVFVQRAGELFERRFVRTEESASGWIAIAAGLRPGERVVVRGAHAVKLASAASAIPAHGHAH